VSRHNSIRELRRALAESRGKQHEDIGNLDLIGMEMAPHRSSRANRLTIQIITAGVIAALVVVGVRNDITGMRYEAAEALRLEQALRDQKLSITVEMRRLRDPRELSQRAAKLGFVRPEQFVDLAEPSLEGTPGAAPGLQP
jgi:hypothetical protein